MQRLSAFFAFLVFAGCGSATVRSAHLYQQAIQAARENNFQASLFAGACAQGATAGCVAVDQLGPTHLPHTLSILQGYTTASSTQISVVVPRDRPLDYYLWDSKENRLLTATNKVEFSRPTSPWAAVKITFRQLELGHLYRLDVVDDRGRLLDTRQLTALNTHTSRIKFAVASCMSDDFKKEQGPMWKALFDQKPELIFLIGDNVYGDSGLAPNMPADPAYLLKRYIETRQTLDLYKAEHLTPVLATWDDHDFGQNDGDLRYPYKTESKEIFSAFFAQDPDPDILVGGPGVASRLTAFGHRFYLTDDRSFRTPDNAEGVQSHYGKEQLEWLLKDMDSWQSPIFLFQGDQFFGGYHKFESYEGNHPQDFQKFIHRLAQIPSPVFFISGDRHLTELMEISPKDIGYRTYELTTSGIHVKTYPSTWDKQPNPRQIAGVANTLNFAIVDSTVWGANWNLHLMTFGPDSRVLFDREVQVRH
jgi:hypothetical protein